jgi:cytoskeletal protein RodZ
MKKAGEPLKNNQLGAAKQQKDNSVKSLLIILIIIIVLMMVGFAIVLYFIMRGNQPSPSNTPTPSTSSSETATASPKKRVGWETYNNSRFGFSVQVPPKLEKTESINNDGATFTTWDPPMTIRIWAVNNDQNLTAQQAIDFDKQDYALNEVENLRVPVEGPIEMGGQSAVESVWQYTVPSTGDASTSARAYTVKGTTIYKIEFAIATNQWDSYSTMFDDVFTSFEFK